MESPPAIEELAAHFRKVLEERARELAVDWLGRLMARLPESPNRVFPEATLLDHVPMVLRRVAEAFEGADPTAYPEVRDDLSELAQLRRSQGYSLDELVEELDILGEVVCSELQLECARFPGASLEDGFMLARRLQQALARMTSVTMKAYGAGITSDLARRSRLLDSFGRAVSHELRNRLNVVNLAVQLCQKEAGSLAGGERMTAQLAGISERLERVEDVVADVFAISIAHGHADPGGDTIRPLNEVVKNVVTDVEPLARERGVALDVERPVPPIIVDAPRLQLILINLVSNAIKYSDPKKSERWVKLDSHVSGPGTATLRVRDNGVGIRDEDRHRIFAPFERGSAPSDRGGHGLGLALAREAAEQLGAALRLEDHPTETVFSLVLALPDES